MRFAPKFYKAEELVLHICVGILANEKVFVSCLRAASVLDVGGTLKVLAYPFMSCKIIRNARFESGL